ncbi:hypothetical protein TW65_06551 [Stemphylium lycopersici]|nr:hypothetical protein TW65_06551 [Stemphylium lycopersici]
MDRGSLYEHDIPSLSASLEAFNPERSMDLSYGRRSINPLAWPASQEEAESDTESEKGRSLLDDNAARARPSKSPFQHRTDRDVTPSHIPLPESPYKQTPRASPEPITSIPPWRDTLFMRFAYRGEAKFRTAPIEDTISGFASGLHIFTRSRANVIFTVGLVILSWLLLQPWTASLIPDVANVANMAKQFEPLLYASENVIPRSRELADGSIAVQDLGESVRATNMSASSVIIDQLDDLGDSLKILSEKITSFFTNVDGDMDSILITMEWAQRELQGIQGPKIGMIDTVIGNIHGGLGKIGLLERKDGSPTAVGRVVNDVLGHTTQQRSKATIQRTFDYLLSTLEENIANELARADTLFQLFESVDRQFHNLHRSVAREEDSLANRKDEFLASMWRMTINNKMKIKKYEKNLKLLKDVRASTLTNKSELKGHIQIIMSVKDQLDKARKNLISPLIRRAQSNSFGLEQQLNDLTGTYGFLKGVRDVQKRKVLLQLWGEPKERVTITAGEKEGEIKENEWVSVSSLKDPSDQHEAVRTRTVPQRGDCLAFNKIQYVSRQCYRETHGLKFRYSTILFEDSRDVSAGQWCRTFVNKVVKEDFAKCLNLSIRSSGLSLRPPGYGSSSITLAQYFTQHPRAKLRLHHPYWTQRSPGFLLLGLAYAAAIRNHKLLEQLVYEHGPTLDLDLTTIRSMLPNPQGRVATQLSACFVGRESGQTDAVRVVEGKPVPQGREHLGMA